MSKKLINGKILSIQLGREETRIVLVGKNSEILHGITVPTPAGAVEDGMIHDQEAIGAMLKEALETPEFKGVRQAVFSLCTSQVILETATTPDLPKAKLEKLIQANADMYFPVDIQDYRLVWEVVDVRKNDSGAKEAAVQLWAVPNEMLRGYYQAANACGLSVAAIDYCGHSVATAVGATFARPAKPPKAKAPKAPKDPEAPQEPKPKKKIDWNAEITFGRKKKVEPEVPQNEEAGPREIPGTDMHILMDKDLLGLTFVQKGQVVYQRFYRCGSDPTYQFGELAMMVEYFQNQEIGRGSEIRGYVSGPGSMDPEMVELLSGMVGIPLEPFQSGMDQCWLLCAGAARTTLEFGNPDFNKAVRVRRTINTDLWQYAAILASGVALVAVVLMLLNSRLGWNSEISQLENTRDLLQIQSAQVNGFKENYDNYETEYAAYDRDWDALFNSLHTYNDNLVFVLEELENVMPANTSVTDIIIDSDSVMISFACDDKEEAAYLIMSLRDMEYVDVNTISNLIGGGKGAATDYGTPIEEVMPPTEGGTEEETQQETALPEETGNNGIAVAAETGSTQDYLTALKTLESSEYAKIPDTKLDHTSFDALKAKHTGLTFEQRAAAMRSLIGTNPFAANHFVALMKEDVRTNTYGVAYYLLDYMDIHPEVSEELSPLMTLMKGGTVDWSEIQKAMNTALDILTETEDILGKTETMLCTDSYMQTSYIHYLEVQLGLRASQTHPYLNPETVAPNGTVITIDTDNDALNEWVNAELAKYQVPAGESVACPACCTHVDSNTDDFCDNCGTNMGGMAPPCVHIDSNGDGKCDTCGEPVSGGEPGCKHENKEACTRLPEVFGEELKHTATCPDCGEIIPEEVCTDADKDNKCDHCGEKTAVTRSDIETLRPVYSADLKPSEKNPQNLEKFLEEKDPTYYEREAAVINLFITNAFAANSSVEDAINLIDKKYLSLVEGDVPFDTVISFGLTMLKQKITGTDEAFLDNIEQNLICGGNAAYDLENAYLYYLELAMGERTWEKETYPHLEAKKEDDSSWNKYVWDYIANILDEEGMTTPRTPNYADMISIYLKAASKDEINGVDEVTLAELNKYFAGESSELGSTFDNILQDKVKPEAKAIRDLLQLEFYYKYYQESDTRGKNARALIDAYINGQIEENPYSKGLLLTLQQLDREAQILKDDLQDEAIKDHEQRIEALEKELEALKKTEAEKEKEEEGAAGGGGGGYRDTRVFLDIGLLYTEELWDQELQRKGLDRSAKLPKLEVEVG